MLIFTNLVFTWFLIKQVAGQDVKSKIVKFRHFHAIFYGINLERYKL